MPDGGSVAGGGVGGGGRPGETPGGASADPGRADGERPSAPGATTGDLLERVRATGLLAAGRPVVVLLSGGRDSVCLLDVAVLVCGAGAVAALHVDYGLRDAAAADARSCAALCERLGVGLEVRRPRRPEGAGNLQAWARDVRYAAASALALERGADVAAGHTATDQAETVLYRLASSPGRRALLGMRARSGRLVRPLLGVTREETAAWCRARGLGWREDESNTTGAYARGRVRGGLVPALREVHPAAERNVVRTAALLRDEAAVLDEVVAGTLAGRDRIAVARLAELPGALARLVLVRLAEAAVAEERTLPAAAERLGDVLAAPEGAAVAVQGGVELVVEEGTVRARRREACPPGGPVAPVALEVPGSIRFGPWTLTARPAVPDAREGVLAAAGPFTVRARRPGDRIAPLGMGGHTKSLQDVLVDRKVPRAHRATLPVVECAGEVAWVPGVVSSERFRVTPGTTRAVALEAALR